MKSWQLSKITPAVTLVGTFGIGQVQVGLGLELERVGRLGEIDFASKIGPSPLNLAKNLEAVRYLHGLDLEEKMHMDVASVEAVREQLKEVSFECGAITSVGQVNVIRAKFGTSVDPEEAMIASLFLCITYAVGDKSAVRCIKNYLTTLSKEATSGTPTIDGAWLETYLEKLRKCLFLAGPMSKFEDMVDEYNLAFHQGLPWNEAYVKPVEKVVEALLQKLGGNTGASSVWYTRSRKVHKLAYLLCCMGWNVWVEPSLETLAKPSKLNLTVKFTSEVDVEGGLIEAELYSAGVSAPKRMMPSVEDEQGPGMRVSKEGLVHAIRAVLNEKHTDGRAIEEAWALGYQIGEKCKVKLTFGKAECSYKFGESTYQEEKGGSPSAAAEDVVYEIDRSLKKYAPMLHKIVNGNWKDYENISNRLKSVFRNRNAKLFGEAEKIEDDKLRMVVAFYFGVVYGKLEALLVATGLSEDSAPLQFRIGWMDFVDQFLHDVHARMWELSKTNLAPPSMHSVFLFLGMCCTNKSIYFGKQVPLEDIVGFWTGTSLVMLATAMQPGIDPEEGAKLENYPAWIVNLSTVDGVHLQSSKWIEGEERIQNFATGGAPDTLQGFEIPPKCKLSIYLSPNYMEENATLVHSMMCNGDIVYVAPVMGALVNLHNKTIPCSCDGTEERRLSCRGGLPIYSGEFMLGQRTYHGNIGEKAEMPEEVGVVMAREDASWRFAASSIYHDTHFAIAESCLSCAREGKVDGKWGEYII